MLLLGQQAVGAIFALKILQFYAVPGEIAPGEQTTICYGVEDAVSVRIEPAVEKLRPTFSRCFSVSPKRSTTYKLTVEGPGQQQVSRTAQVVVKAAPRPAPVIHSFSASQAQIKPGGHVNLCFFIENADSVRLEPSTQELGNARLGCFAVAPQQTTTYTLVAESAGGKAARKQVTVKVE